MAEGGAQIDLPAHTHTYARFIRIAKIGAGVCFVIAFVVIFIISR